MRFPVRLIWDLIGDVYENVFDDDNRRPIDLLWQSYGELSGQLLNYVDMYKRSRNIFEVDVYAPWGSYYTLPRLIDATSQIDGLILGQRNGQWIAITPDNEEIPSRGGFGLFSSTINYAPGTTEQLLSNRSVSIMSSSYSEEVWDEVNNPSYVFSEDTVIDGTGRWVDGGTPALTPTDEGLLFEPTDSNWSILQDQFYFSGDQDWEQLWRVRIEQWEDVSDFTRSMSVYSFGDTGSNFEVRLDDDGETITCSTGMYAKMKYVEFDFSGSTVTQSTGSFLTQGFRIGMTLIVLGTASNDGEYTITNVTAGTITVAESFTLENSVTASLTTKLEPMTGDTVGWRADLLASSDINPVYIEFMVRYEASTAEMYSEVYFGDDTLRQTNVYSVAPGRRKHSFSVFNQVLNVKAYLEWMAALKGRLWDSTEILDFTTSIGDSFGYIYQVEEPLTDSSKIQWGPYDLTPPAQVEQHIPSTEITVVLNEDYKDYAPEYVRIEGNSYVIGELASQTGATVTYRIISESSPGLQFQGEVQVHPWFLNTSEFEWIGPSIFATQRPLPFEDKECFFIEAVAEELELYDRYGRELKMPNRPDSQEYLDALRGMSFGLTNTPTPEAVSRGVGILLGLPYTNESGFIEGISRVTDDLGAPLYDNVTVNGRTVRTDPIWRDSDLLLPVGTFIDALTPLVESVSVYDWKTNIELIQEKTDVWKSWGTFVLQIPGSIGLNATKAGDLFRYLYRSKDVHTNYIVEFNDVRSEDHFNDTWETLEGGVNEVYAHTLEDMVFDDHGEVVLNALDYYPDVGGSVDYSEEWQQPDTLTLDAGHKLDQFEALDATSLRVFDVKKIHNGLTLGGDDWPQRPAFHYDFRNAGVDMNRELNADETAASLTRRVLRMSSPNDGQTYFHRPYSLCFPFTGASPQFSVRDGGGTLYSYHTQGYSASNPTNTDDLHDAYIDSSNLAWVVGNGGAIYETTDYGENWSDASIVTADNFRGTHRFWAVGTNSLAYERVAGTWTSRTITGSTVDFIDIFWIDSSTGWAVANNGLDCESYKTTNGGSTWDPAVSINAGTQVTAVHFADATNGWVSTDGGLYRTNDGGGTWTLETAVAAYNGVHCISPDIIIAIDNATNGNIVRSTNGTDAGTVTFSTVETLTSNQFNDVHFMDSNVGTAVGTGGSAYHSYDGGVTWTSETISSEVWSGVHTAAPWFRLVVGPDAGTNDVSRWR